MLVGKNTKEIIVFGAGASYASAGKPLGKDLVWSYYEDCSGLYRIENGKPAEADLQEKRSEFINYEKFLNLADKIFPDLGATNKWQKQMQEGMMFGLPFQLDKKYYVDEMANILWTKGDSEGIELLRQLVLEHIGQASLGHSNSLYKEFVTKLVGKSLENVSIISFNFDCLLQEDFRNEVYCDYLIPFNMIDEHRTSYNKRNGIPLIKLNGSLDWAICPTCKKIKLLFPHIHKNSYDKLYCVMTKDCRRELKPLIFLPHEEKNDMIHLLWKKAREDLTKATKITVIGYSFPYYDNDVIDLFKEHVSPDIDFEIIDYAHNDAEKSVAEENAERIKKLLSLKKGIKLYLDGFQGYIHELKNKDRF